MSSASSLPRYRATSAGSFRSINPWNVARTTLCGLSAFQNDYSKDELKKIYGNKKTYKSRFEKRLSELEKAGWSLPMYHDMILSDAAKVDF